MQYDLFQPNLYENKRKMSITNGNTELKVFDVPYKQYKKSFLTHLSLHFLVLKWVGDRFCTYKIPNRKRICPEFTDKVRNAQLNSVLDMHRGVETSSVA